MPKKIAELPDAGQAQAGDLFLISRSNSSYKILKEKILPAAICLTVGLESADYIADPDNLDIAWQEAIDAVANSTWGKGLVYVKAGDYLSAQVIWKNGVSLQAESRGTHIKGKTNAAPCILKSEDFDASAGFGNAFAGISHVFIDGFNFEGGTQVASGGGDYRDMNAVIKVYGWDLRMSNIRIDYASELSLYTEHDNDWNDDGTFNTYEFGENVYKNIRMKNYGKVGWVNRGSHDSYIDSVYISSSDDSFLNPDYGYIQETNGAATKRFGSNGASIKYLHVWGNHNHNAVLLDNSNVIDGFIYAEGSDEAAIYIKNGSSANKFNAFVGYCTNGVEFAGASNGNDITCVIESNVSGAMFKLNDATSNNILRQGSGYGQPGGAVFDLATANYTGSKNRFELWAGNTATPLAGYSVMSNDDLLIGAGGAHLQYSPKDVYYSGTTILVTGGESLVFGDVTYVKSDSKMGKADADAIATSGAIFLALGTIANNAKGLFLVNGVVRNDSLYNLTPGGLIYLSTTAGGITQTPPSGPADVVQILGVALTADKWLFSPNLGMIEIVS